MSYVQRIAPLLLATAVGVASGVYIFDGPLKQYKQDTQGTFDPDQAVPAINSSPDVLASTSSEDASTAIGNQRQAMIHATQTAAAGAGGASGDSPIAKAIWKQTTEALQEIKNKATGAPPTSGKPETHQV